MLTQERANELFLYDPTAGQVRRRVQTSNYKASKGRLVGSKHNTGYLAVNVAGRQYLLHRVIWLMVYGEFPTCEVDHINRIKTDNRLCNLRAISNTHNRLNQGLGKNNTSGVRGVHFFKRRNCWQVYIDLDRKRKNLGYYSTLEEAVERRRQAEILYCVDEYCTTAKDFILCNKEGENGN